MIFIGHRFLPSSSLYHIDEIEDILKTPSGSTVYLLFSENNLDIIEHLRLNHIPFALEVQNITELLYSATLGAKYVLSHKENAKELQGIIEEYLFDLKLLIHIHNEEEIEEMALLGIDGVVFPSGIVKVA